MKKALAILCACLLIPSLSALAQNSEFDDLPMNGLASFEQLRKEYYIGALQLERLTPDAERIVALPGKKRMAIRITADRWPPLRFAQQWNQAILINNDSQTLNANVMDLLAFTSLPKEDLVAGDRLHIDLLPDNGTRVSINGIPLMQTANGALFNLILNSWIGQRPPSTEFKSSLLVLATDAESSALLSRFEATEPDQTRRQLIAGWAEPSDQTAAVATTTSLPSPGNTSRDTIVRARMEPVSAPPILAAPPARPLQLLQSLP